jgi:hypothetical protein
VNWMYEEGGGPAYGENAELEAAKEEEQNEAYLLGKEYVPKGQEKQVGDFAVAATMGGVLEKASTRGATIGVGESAEAMGAASVRLKDDNEVAVREDDGRSEFNREFHLRHEDPMFAVHQKRESQRKEVEKKRNLMERAGLVVKEVKRGDAERDRRSPERDVDDKRRAKKDRSGKRKKHHKHRHRRDRSSSVSSRSASSCSSSHERRHRKKRDKKHHRHHSRRRHRSFSRERSPSADRKYDDRKPDPRRDADDRRDRHYHEERERSRSRDRYRDSRDRPGHQHDDDSLDEFGRKRHHAPDERGRGSGDRYDKAKDVHQHGAGRNRDERDRSDRSSSRQRDSKSDRRTQHHEVERHRDDVDGKKQNNPPTKEGYGLIGTSLSGQGRETDSSNTDINRHTSLGPSVDLLTAKRREVDHERQAKLEQSRRRWDRDGRSIDRVRALEEMKRDARRR